jgi:hypothetical protein
MPPSYRGEVHGLCEPTENPGYLYECPLDGSAEPPGTAFAPTGNHFGEVASLSERLFS